MKKMVLIMGVLLFMESAAFAKDSLRGSRTKVRRAYDIAVDHNYSFLCDKAQVEKFKRLGLLVRVRENAHLRLNDVSYPFARPEVALFIRRLAEQHHNGCGFRLVVTSIVRTIDNQPPNASPLSVHPTGMAVDLRVPKIPTCRRQLEENLRLLQRRGVALVTKEKRPPHYHVVLFPRQYAEYLRRRGVVVAVK